MIIHMDRPFANDYPDGAALLQLIDKIDWPFGNDRLDGPAFCKWSSEWAGLLQMIIRIGRSFANNHSDGPAFCKWSSRFLPLSQILLHFYFHFQQISYFPLTNIFLLLQILGSRLNLADLSKTTCSCFTFIVGTYNQITFVHVSGSPCPSPFMTGGRPCLRVVVPHYKSAFPDLPGSRPKFCPDPMQPTNNVEWTVGIIFTNDS